MNYGPKVEELLVRYATSVDASVDILAEIIKTQQVTNLTEYED